MQEEELLISVIESPAFAYEHTHTHFSQVTPYLLQLRDVFMAAEFYKFQL